MRLALVVATAVGLVACVPPKRAAAPAVRAEDVASWAGVPLIELETHAVFSILPKETHPLSDGSEMWTFSVCATTTSERDCKAAVIATGPNASFARSKCKGGETSESCCRNQFIVREGVVESYRPTGTCWTDCRARPQSRACAP